MSVCLFVRLSFSTTTILKYSLNQTLRTVHSFLSQLLHQPILRKNSVLYISFTNKSKSIQEAYNVYFQFVISSWSLFSSSLYLIFSVFFGIYSLVKSVFICFIVARILTFLGFNFNLWSKTNWIIHQVYKISSVHHYLQGFKHLHLI